MSGKTMRAVDIKGGTGPASSLFINNQIAYPQIKPTECLIKVRAFGLNRADTMQREGKYPMPPWAPTIMGLEFSGTIEEVGTGAQDEPHHWKVGDEVFGLAYGGTYAEYVNVSKRMLMRKPAQLSWEQCAGVPEVYFTALQSLHVVGAYSPETHKTVLWHAAASAVSIAGIQLTLGANEHTADESHADYPPPIVLATARQDDKCEMAVKLGAKHAINTKTHPNDWADIAVQHSADQKGVDLVIDYVGAPFFQGNLDCMAMSGRIVNLAALGGSKLPEGVDIGGFVRKRIRFEGSTLRSRDEQYQSHLRDLFEKKVLPGMIAGKFDPNVETVVSWSQISEMHEKMERNETKGKIVCLVD